jgi:putative N-acetylmannosamine-6-phosphate epimerase
MSKNFNLVGKNLKGYTKEDIDELSDDDDAPIIRFEPNKNLKKKPAKGKVEKEKAAKDKRIPKKFPDFNKSDD